MVEDKNKKNYSNINWLPFIYKIFGIIPNYTNRKIVKIPKFTNYKNQKIDIIPIVINNKIITNSKNIIELR